MSRRLLLLALTALLVTSLVPPAVAHPERDATFPSGDLNTPAYRFDGPTVVVCKPDTPARLRVLPAELRVRNEALLAQCAFVHLNEAIIHVRDEGVAGTRILLMPGVYREQPYVGDIAPACMEVGSAPGGEDAIDVGAVPLPPPDDPAEDEGDNTPGALVLTYEEQMQCPYLQNLIPILGDTDLDGVCDNSLCDLQIEGTGASPLDTVIDGDYSQLNGIRADRADSLHLRNFTVQRFEFNAVYILESDGFTFDEMLARWNDEYGFLSFAVDHGLYQNCEGYGNGDSAVYPGSASDLNADAGLFDDNDDLRLGTEIRGCRGHHNALGYSGTTGNSIHTHHNEFDHNVTGAAMDSLFPDHPGLPQDHAYFHDNVFHSNNASYYTDFVQTGRCTGPFRDRDYDEGVVCPVVPLPVGTGLILAGGNHNLYEANVINDNWRQGTFQFFVPATLRGEDDPLLQFDGSGTFEVPGAPLPDDCDDRAPFTPGPGIAAAAGCAEYSRDDNPEPPGCNWFSHPQPPADRNPQGPTIERLGGPDRIATSVLASRDAFPRTSHTVVIATAEAFADALAGAPLAAHLQAPLLITGRDGLDARVSAEIQRLGATRVWLLGGTAALSDAVEADLTAAGARDITRLGGGDRFETAVQIAEAIGSGNAFLVEGNDFASALAASAVGALVGRPVLLTPADSLAPSLVRFLEGGLMVDIRIVGSAVTESVERALADVAPLLTDVRRTAGADALEVLENLRVVGGTAALSPAILDDLVALTGGTEGDVRGDRSHGTHISGGRFAPLPGAPAAYDGLTGTATMTRTLHGTTEVEVLVQGTPEETVAAVHVHVDSCAEGGGDHFAFDPSGPAMPPNEIHPSFVSDAVGVGRGTDTAFAVAGNDARSVVIHDPDGTKVACADLRGGDIPEDLVTTPALASFMADPWSRGDSRAHRWFVDGQVWLWLAMATWLTGSFALRHHAHARRRLA